MSALFMNYDLVWFQIQEMLRIEGGGEEQVQDELQVARMQLYDDVASWCLNTSQAYNPLVPQKNEVVIALSIEVLGKQQVLSIDWKVLY
jgi:hypothetical protein